MNDTNIQKEGRLIFERTEFGRYKKLKKCWRRPRGLQNKLRVGKKGIKPKIGYKKPKKGEIIRIFNLEELKELKPKEIIIASCVGKKKRLEILKFCEKNKIKVLNIK
jgi:ribosomal protein L32E